MVNLTLPRFIFAITIVFSSLLNAADNTPVNPDPASGLAGGNASAETMLEVLQFRVPSSMNDAEQELGGRMRLTSSDLEMTRDATDQIVGIRFPNVQVPPDSTLAHAYLQFKADISSNEPTRLSVRAQAAAYAPVFSSERGNLADRPLTITKVDWSPEPWERKNAGPAQRSPDLLAVVQEVMARPGWEAGNSIVFIITGTGLRGAEAYDGDRDGAPLLSLEFSVGDTDTVTGVEVIDTTDTGTAIEASDTTDTGTVIEVSDTTDTGTVIEGGDTTDTVAAIEARDTTGTGTPVSEDVERLLAQVPIAMRHFVDNAIGVDAGNGDREHPWKSIRFGISQLPAGHTLYLREGVYREADLDIVQNGSGSNWTTIRNFPLENVIIDGSESAFVIPGTGAWELIDASTRTYRSTSSNYGSKVVLGKAYLPDGRKFTLVPYFDSSGEAYGNSDLQSDEYNVTAGARYVGPGLYNDGGQLYIRLQQLPATAVYGRDLSVPLSENPNDVELRLGSSTRVFEVTGSFVVISGLELRGARYGVELSERVRQVKLDDIVFDVAGSGLLLRDGVSNVLLESSRIEGSFPPWVAWTDMKGGDGQSHPASHSSFKTSGVNGNFISNVFVRNNKFVDTFDGMVVQGRNIEVRDNQGVFFDDMIQLGSNSENVEIVGNRIVGAGPSHYGKGDSLAPGTTYIHDNVIDARREYLWGKSDPGKLLRSSYGGWRASTPFPTHSKSALNKGDPWKIYDNTVVFNGRDSTHGVGFELWAELNDTGASHEVYNNVFLEVGGGHFVRNIDVEAGPQVYDGNIYWRSNGNSDEPMFEDIVGHAGNEDYNTLDEFRTSANVALSINWYAPGWEANGSDTNPRVDSEFYPSVDGPAATGAVPLPNAFPGVRHAYRGALPPR